MDFDSMKIALFYPHADILERKSGASKRTGHLIDFLKDRCSELIVISTGPVAFEDVIKEKVKYTYYHHHLIGNNRILQSRLRRLYKNIFSSFSRMVRRDDVLQLWKHYEYCIDFPFIRYATDIVNWADVIFLEYTYLASPVANIARRKMKPVFITSHDVLSDQVKTIGRLKRLTLKAEVNALMKADFPVCVSEADQQLFSLHGVKATVIPHGIDFESSKKQLSNNDFNHFLSEIGGSAIPRKRVCLFVGTPHPPNIMSVNMIRKIAKSLAVNDKGRQINFIVAGECCAPGRKDNFYSLGKVSDGGLYVLYQISEVVLVPLLEGTGASVKTIEAMAHGKVVVGTTVGFRGYPVINNYNCIISDDIEGYPRIIMELFDDPERMFNIKKNAIGFAEKYDYRQLYKTYLEFFKNL